MTAHDADGTFRARLRGICPFCKLAFEAGEDKEGPAVLHEIPICKTFDDLAMDEFLKAVRLRYSE